MEERLSYMQVTKDRNLHRLPSPLSSTWPERLFYTEKVLGSNPRVGTIQQKEGEVS